LPASPADRPTAADQPLTAAFAVSAVDSDLGRPLRERFVSRQGPIDSKGRDPMTTIVVRFVSPVSEMAAEY
jgi:hypothetical protein